MKKITEAELKAITNKNAKSIALAIHALCSMSLSGKHSWVKGYGLRNLETRCQNCQMRKNK